VHVTSSSTQQRTASPTSVVDAARAMLDAFEFFDTQWRRDWGLSAMEKLVITHLWSQRSASMTQLAERIGMTSGGATSLVDRLERDGYVARASDPQDRRRQIVTLTDKGAATREMLDITLNKATEDMSADAALEVLGVLRHHFETQASQLVERIEDPLPPGATATAPGEAPPASA
jgi:DNA-binding MarR family transcriptional regulator